LTAFGASTCSAVVPYAFGSSVLGDGYVELTKHFLLGQVAAIPALVFTLAWAGLAIGERLRRGRSGSLDP
jgi:hypothetical protein